MKRTSVSGKYTLESEEEISLEAPVIKVYEQEIDERYLLKDGENNSDVLETLLEKVENINSPIHETANKVNEVSGKLDNEILERKTENQEEQNIRLNEDNKLQNQINDLTSNFDNYYSKEQSNYNYYLKDEVYNKIETYNKSEVYNKSDVDNGIIDKVKREVVLNAETFDLIIIDEKHLHQVLEDGIFEKSSRILFKSGNYIYSGNKSINFYNIASIKGEEETNVEMRNSSIFSLSHETVKFENIHIIIGQIGADIVIDSNGRAIKSFTLSGGDINIELDKYHEIYRFDVRAETRITLENIIDGKDYTFYFDQKQQPFQFAIGNALHNAVYELQNPGFSLENLEGNTRTVINAIGINYPTKNGLTITSIIPKVITDIKNGIFIELGNINGKIWKSNQEIPAIHNIIGTNICHGFLSTVTIYSDFINDSWTHSKKDYDWRLYNPINNQEIKTGKIGENVSFTMPDLQNVPKLILDFEVEPNLFTVVIDEVYRQKDIINISSMQGFFLNNNNSIDFIELNLEKYQPRYNEVRLHFEVKDEFFLNLIHDNLDRNNQRTMPWKFVIPEMPKQNRLILSPDSWKRIEKIENYIEVLNTPEHYFNSNLDNRRLIAGIINKVHFVINPADASAPISITDYDETKLKVSSYDQINHIMNMELIGNLQSDEIISFIARTTRSDKHGGEYTIQFNVPITIGIDSLDIKGKIESNTDNEVIRHMTVGEDVDYEYYIDWKENPTFKNGYWTSSNMDVALIKGDEDKAILTVRSQGDTIIKFVSDYDITKYTILNVHVHAHPFEVKIDNNPILVKTSTTYIPQIKWYANNFILSEIQLENTNGFWTIEEGQPNYVNIDLYSGRITINNDPIPKGELNNKTKIRFTSNDTKFDKEKKLVTNEPIIDIAEIIISRNSYLLEFTSNDSNFLGVSNYAIKSLHLADIFINPNLLFINGFVLSDESRLELDKIKNDPNREFKELGDSDGTYRFSFSMPYEDIKINITAK